MLSLALPFVALTLQGQVESLTRGCTFASESGLALVTGQESSSVSPSATQVCPFTGRSDITCTVGGESRWHCQLGFVFEEACVLDDGRMAGIAWGEQPHSDVDNLHLVLIDPHGQLLLDERVGLAYLGAEPPACVNPPQGWFVDVENDRFVVRLWRADRGSEEWRVWSLSKGQSTGWTPTVLPGGGLAFGPSSSGAAPVPGTPLTLVHGWVQDERPRLFHASYALLDANGKQFWAFEVPKDRAERVDRRPVAGANGIVSTGKLAFSVRLFQAAQVVRFQVARDAQAEGGWGVKEVGREAWPPKH